MEDKKDCIKCENCRYFTGVKCHGHGEYWGNCMLLDFCVKENEQIGKYDYISTGFGDICYPDTHCILMTKFDFHGVHFNDKKDKES